MADPRSIERALLGSVLTFGAGRWNNATGVGLAVDDFGGAGERVLAAAIDRIVKRGEDVVLPVIEAELGRDIELVGGLVGLDAMTKHATGHAEQTLAKRILGAAARRRTRAWHIEQANRIESGELELAEDWQAHQAAARGEFSTLCELGQLRDEPEGGAAVGLRAYNRMIAVAAGQIPGVPTGHYKLDQMCGGRGPEPGDLVVVAGRPAMGKTAWALSLTRECLFSRTAGQQWAWGHKDNPTPVLWACGEMGNAQLMGRIWADLGSFDGRMMRSPSEGWLRRFTPDIVRITGMVEQAPLAFVDDPSANRLERVIAAARKWRARQGPGPAVVVVDYLQRMEFSGVSSRASREEKVSAMAMACKTLARELDVVVVLLAQLNRQCEQRPDKRPMMSDLRESGAIEQESDLVVGLYRDHVYHPETARPEDAELLVLKNRNGPLGMVPARFVGRHFRFCEPPAPEFDGAWEA